MKVIIRPAELGDDEAIWSDIRQSDIDEMLAVNGRAQAKSLTRGITMSDVSWFAEVDGEPAALFGAATDNVMLRTGTPWMLGTNVLDQVPVVFARHSVRYIRDIARRYTLLTNYVDVRNEPTIQWLKWLGFELHDPVDSHITGMPMSKFTMKGQLDV